MPIYDNDITTNHQIGKIYDNDITTNYQIGKVYDHDGTAGHLIYSAEEILITDWVVNDNDQYEPETSETKTWNIEGFSYADIIIYNTRNYDTAGGTDWVCHNRTIINGTTYNAEQGDKTYTISLSGKTTLTVQLISSAHGGGLSGAYPITCKSIRVY